VISVVVSIINQLNTSSTDYALELFEGKFGRAIASKMMAEKLHMEPVRGVP